MKNGKKEIKVKDSRTFAQKHPKLNSLRGLLILFALIYIGWIVIGWSWKAIQALIDYLKNIAKTLDAVIVVALITGTVSIVGVIFTSVISKIIDYRAARRDYLAKKREAPYGEFVEMVYSIQQNIKNPGTYSEEEMLLDLSKFSKQITLWGSSNVVNKWVAFRENGNKTGEEVLFILEDIMNEMRKDLGLKRVKKGNLLAFFINDIKQVMKKNTK